MLTHFPNFECYRQNEQETGIVPGQSFTVIKTVKFHGILIQQAGERGVVKMVIGLNDIIAIMADSRETGLRLHTITIDN